MMPSEYPFTWFLAAFGTSQVVLAALCGWLGKLWIDRISRNEKSQVDQFLQAQKARIDTQAVAMQHIGKARFDLEVRIYVELWNELHEMKEAVNAIQLHAESDDGGSQSLISKATGFDSSSGRVMDVLQRNKPFYAPSVHAHAFELLKAGREAAKRATVGQSPIRPRAEAIQDMIFLQKLSDSVAEAIRHRLYGDAMLNSELTSAAKPR